MRGAIIFRPVLLTSIAVSVAAIAGCESNADRAANDPYSSSGPRTVTSATPDSPIGAAPASPNTNGIRGEQTVGERSATGSVSSGTGSPGVAPALQRDANGNVIVPPAPVTTSPPSDGAPVPHQ